MAKKSLVKDEFWKGLLDIKMNDLDIDHFEQLCECAYDWDVQIDREATVRENLATINHAMNEHRQKSDDRTQAT